MAKIDARVFKGARDFLPEQMLQRERIVHLMRSVFKKYGYDPVETPAIEYLNVLTGKYGDEADRLIYKLNYKTGSKDEAALHYDLTVPFSRMVAMHPDLPIPFKRYQIQPVWRADRPQPHQGRFREFYQCDVDCVGSESMLIEAELIAINFEILTALNIPDFLIKINNRKILNGITEYIGLDKTYVSEVCTSIDKLDKVAWTEVEKELSEKNIPTASIQKLHDLISKEITLEALKTELSGIEIAQEGIRELEDIFNYLQVLQVPATSYTFDISLARGLDYYTGPIYEIKLSNHPHIGSLGGGGRYNGLIAYFGGRDLPSVGTSLGLDRIYTALEQLNLLTTEKTSTKVLVCNFGKSTLQASLEWTAELRKNGIAAELYPDATKMGKQFTYCDKKQIPFVCIIGEEELQNNLIGFKDMHTGLQEKLTKEEILALLK